MADERDLDIYRRRIQAFRDAGNQAEVDFHTQQLRDALVERIGQLRRKAGSTADAAKAEGHEVGSPEYVARLTPINSEISDLEREWHSLGPKEPLQGQVQAYQQGAGAGQSADERQQHINKLRQKLGVFWNAYPATEGKERLEMRAVIIRTRDELDALEGNNQAESEYPIESEAEARRHVEKARPTQAAMFEFFRGHPDRLPPAKSAIKTPKSSPWYPYTSPEHFSDEQLQEQLTDEDRVAIQEIQNRMDAQQGTGDEDEDYDETLGNFSAGQSGPSEDWLQAQRAAQDQARADRVERERIAAEQREAFASRRDKAQLERDEARRQFEREKQAQRQQEQAAREQRNAQNAQQQQQQAALRQQKQKQSVHRQLALQTTQAAIGAINDTKVTLGNLPQPGGIGVMLIVIIFMLLAIAPMNGNGDTRLQLLWLSFWGKTSLPTSFKDKFGGSDTAAVAAAIAAGIRTGLSSTDTSATADTSADASSSTVSPLGSALESGSFLPFASGGF